MKSSPFVTINLEIVAKKLDITLAIYNYGRLEWWPGTLDPLYSKSLCFYQEIH
jgi:hypothetical protein